MSSIYNILLKEHNSIKEEGSLEEIGVESYKIFKDKDGFPHWYLKFIGPKNSPYEGETAIEPFLYYYADDGKYVTRSRTVDSSEYLGNNRWLCTVQVKDKRNRIARVLLHTCEAVNNDNSNTQNYISE
jgi:hypothetical protein